MERRGSARLEDPERLLQDILPEGSARPTLGLLDDLAARGIPPREALSLLTELRQAGVLEMSAGYWRRRNA